MREGSEGAETVGKGEGEFDLDTCPTLRVSSYATV